MPYQGPWSECVHCNNNMLEACKQDASALFWYTQRYHSLRTLEHGSLAGGYLAQSLQQSRRTMDRPPYRRAPRLGPRAFSVSLIN